MTYEQVLACKKVDFSSNQNIRRFNELEYFKNLSTVNFGKSSIEEVSLPYMTISDSQIFNYCKKLKKLTTRYGLKINNGTDLFSSCTSLQSLDTSRWNLSELRNARDMFQGCTNLETLVGNHTETDNVRLFINYDFTSINFKNCPKINLATINAVIRGVGRYGRGLAISLPEPVKSQVTEEYKEILKSKGWKIY